MEPTEGTNFLHSRRSSLTEEGTKEGIGTTDSGEREEVNSTRERAGAVFLKIKTNETTGEINPLPIDSRRLSSISNQESSNLDQSSEKSIAECIDTIAVLYPGIKDFQTERTESILNKLRILAPKSLILKKTTSVVGSVFSKVFKKKNNVQISSEDPIRKFSEHVGAMLEVVKKTIKNLGIEVPENEADIFPKALEFIEVFNSEEIIKKDDLLKNPEEAFAFILEKFSKIQPLLEEKKSKLGNGVFEVVWVSKDNSQTDSSKSPIWIVERGNAEADGVGKAMYRCYNFEDLSSAVMLINKQVLNAKKQNEMSFSDCLYYQSDFLKEFDEDYKNHLELQIAKVENIPRLFGAVQKSVVTEGRNLEYLESVIMEDAGTSLRAMLKQDSSKSFSNEELVNIAKGVGKALQNIGQAGFLHRDIKPGNIVIDNNGGVKVIDFGTRVKTSDEALKTHTLEVAGTPDYLAPEIARCYPNRKQKEGEKLINITSASDVYSLGATLFLLKYGKDFISKEPLKMVSEVEEAHNEREELLKDKVKTLEEDFKERAGIVLDQQLDQFDQLILRMLDPNPEKRPKLSEIVELELET